MEFSRQVYWSGLPFPSPGVEVVEGSKKKKKNSLLNIADCAADLKNKQCSVLTLPQALKELTLSRSGIRCNGVSFPPYLSRLHPEAQKYIP